MWKMLIKLMEKDLFKATLDTSACWTFWSSVGVLRVNNHTKHFRHSKIHTTNHIIYSQCSICVSERIQVHVKKYKPVATSAVLYWTRVTWPVKHLKGSWACTYCSFMKYSTQKHAKVAKFRKLCYTMVQKHFNWNFCL